MAGSEDGIAADLEALGGEFTLADLFTDDWMHAYTDADTIDQFLADSRFDIQSQADFESIPDDRWNDYVTDHTEFPDWGTMLTRALEDFEDR